jgi:tetratricopeptide (TPR) repeat protein
VIRQNQRDFTGAKDAYETALHYGSLGITYENLAIVYMTIGDPSSALDYLHHALTIYPRSPKLLTYLAMQAASMGRSEEAKAALMSAMQYGHIPVALYQAITTGRPLDIPLANSDKVLHLPGAAQ